MTIQCPKCTKCKTCKEIGKINASSYNEFMEQQVLDQLVKYVDGGVGKPGYFISPLPLKPFDINSVRGNRSTADEQNKKMLKRLQQDPQALKQVKDEMEYLQEAGCSTKGRDKRQLID